MIVLQYKESGTWFYANQFKRKSAILSIKIHADVKTFPDIEYIKLPQQQVMKIRDAIKAGWYIDTPTHELKAKIMQDFAQYFL